MKITYLAINHFSTSSWEKSHEYLVKNNKKEVLVEFKDYFSDIMKRFYKEDFDLCSEIKKSHPFKKEVRIDEGFIKFAYLCKDSDISIKFIDRFYYELGLPYVDLSKTNLTPKEIINIDNKTDSLREEFMIENILNYVKEKNEAFAVMHHTHASNILKKIKNIDQEIIIY